MPVNIIASVLKDGKDAIPYYDELAKYVPILATIGSIKWFFSGAINTWERKLHGKVIIMTVSIIVIAKFLRDLLIKLGRNVWYRCNGC